MKTFTRNIMMSIALCFALASAHAQYVTIPDTNFRNWLNTHGFASCMNGNQMDTTCSAVVNATTLNCIGAQISNLTGIRYFDNLLDLRCSSNQLTSLAILPSSLKYLDCSLNNINSLPALPSTLKYFACAANVLNSLPQLPSLDTLYCFQNSLPSLPILPVSLKFLDCRFNNLTSLPTLPSSLRKVDCGSNLLTSIPSLPSLLTSLTCDNNNLASLPTLPATLTTLACWNNLLTSLPNLPSTMDILTIFNNPNLTCLPPINTINQIFQWGGTGIICLPNSISAGSATPTLVGVPICATPSQPGAISGNTNVSPGTSQTYSVTAVANANRYLWSLPSGWTGSSTTNSITATAGNTGGTISVTAKNLCTNTSGPAQTLTVNVQLANYVTIPDPNFVTWLNSHGFSSCMNGNQMDTTCSAVVNATIVDCSNSNIGNLTGIKYFKQLQQLFCSSNMLTSLPVLPASLVLVNCIQNQLTSLTSLPASLQYLDCSYNPLSSLPALPSSLDELHCTGNGLSSLPALPASLHTLYCAHNQLTSLPSLPPYLYTLHCNNNQLISLPPLTTNMSVLEINNNPNLVCLSSIVNININFFYWTNTGITCLSNTITAGYSSPPIAGVPNCVTPTAPTSITVSGGSAKVCPGDTRTYTTPLVSGVTYNWTVPTGSVINSGQGTRTINVTYNNGFTSNGVISVVKKQGCGVSPPKTINVNRNIPATPSTISGTTYGLCGATNKTYSVTQVAGMTYQWTLPAGASFVNGQGTNSVTVNFPSTNFTGTVSVKAVNGCGAGNARNLTVRAVPATPVSVSGAATACANQQNVGYSTAAVATATSYNWTVPTGGVITSGQGSNAIVMKFGTSGGNVRVRAVNGCGAGAYRSKAVAINCREGFSDMVDAFEVVVYPNPSRDYFTVRVLTPTLKGALPENSYSLVVRDVIGRVVYEKEKIISDQNFEFGYALLNGIYFAEIKQGEDRKIVRLIKNN